MPGFVVEYNRKSRDWKVTSFPGPDGHRAAMRHRIELEQARVDADMEIVSLNSDSFETVRKTHARYFEGNELVDSKA
jgi:hypothetical protein